MSKYFSDARNTANASFDSFNGGSEFLNANGGSSAGLGGATSQPYILSVANSTTDAVSDVVVFNAYKALAASATNFDNPAAITISMGISGLTYGEMLYQRLFGNLYTMKLCLWITEVKVLEILFLLRM